MKFLVAILAYAIVSSGCDSAGPHKSVRAGVVEIPVAFAVKNTNTSGVACPSDGADYTVRGHLVGPESEIFGPDVPPLTAYIDGFEDGQWMWRLNLPGYHHAAEMAALGHVSLVADMLGYDSSDHPDGYQSCFGSQADVTHQIIGQLRDGDYTLQGRSPLSFSRIALAGYDIGGTIAHIEAYSYQDLEALVVILWADQGFTPYTFSLIPEALRVCGSGGEDAEEGGPGGYFFFAGTDEQFRANDIPDVEPAVADLVLQLRNRNPCGYAGSFFTALTIDQVRLREIDVPVLLLYPDHNPIISRQGQEQQASHYTGTDDVTTIFVDDSGQYPMFEKTAPAFRAALSGWLRERGF